MDNKIAATVGRRVRRRRRLMGMTQQTLGQACGVSFQQIQKYETASSRMSAIVLWKLAQALGVDVGYFFEGLEQTPASPRPTSHGSVVRLAI